MLKANLTALSDGKALLHKIIVTGSMTFPTRRKIVHRLKAAACASSFIVCVLGSAAEPAPAPPAEAPPPVGQGLFPAKVTADYWDDDLLIPEVFQSHLPITLEKSGLRLWVHPHLGDFQNKDYLRLTTGLRYGITENWEINLGSDFYFSHGYGDSNLHSFDDYGAADVQFGTKLNLGQPIPGWYVGIGFDSIVPLDRAPAQLTDGLRHFLPYVTFSHRLESHKSVRIFFGLRADAVTYTSIPGEFSDNAFRQSSTGVTGGWVIDRKNWHYTFETEYNTTRWLRAGAEEILSFRPGVIWEVPSRRNPNARGHWLIGVAVKCTVGPGGTGLGASLRLRYSRDLKRIPTAR